MEESRDGNKLLELFAQSLSRGGLLNSDCKYVLCVQQLAHSMYPHGFPDIGAVENFLIRHFYPDLPRRGEVYIARCILICVGQAECLNRIECFLRRRGAGGVLR